MAGRLKAGPILSPKRSSWAGLASLLVGVALLTAAVASPVRAAAQPGFEAAKAEIWAKEQAIYAGRGRGDLGPYIRNTSPHYVSWPPQLPAPLRYDAFKAQAAKPGPSRERLTMTLADFALSGDTAVIYYRTHLTMRGDGTLADLRYEVTHTWVREGGVWRVVGGMARATPQR